MAMTPLEKLRAVCLALPEAHEVKAWGAPTFRVNKLFASATRSVPSDPFFPSATIYREREYAAGVDSLFHSHRMPEGSVSNFLTGAVVGALAAFALERSSMLAPDASIVASAGSGVVAPAAATLEKTAGSTAVDPWWSCNSSYTFQQREQNRVRCLVPGDVSELVPTCPVGYAVVVDLSGTIDRCKNMSGGTAAISCAMGYSAVFRAGQDICRKKAPDYYVAPMSPRNL